MLGTKIKKLRINKKIKQIELAKAAGISNSFLSDIENGRTMPSLKTLYKLADALDVSITVFLEDDSSYEFVQ
ncbi:helix-turn-helix domain protein [Mahella australiensis 50-1 BON]|uniref:Helix-turn-helix domain protein n=1 Tax=Mahella australiensis (strain DSM 15567 / CIP 107919 / 50-1 BON) TaxID=697281 RepID=F3ZWZ4_MAHA5|nr:helix-turn-helix transcriptional regulator [Mahella australiensis]AEE97616.1 helix-turn-helix domain protein [Mahella australiensis 50-1 BON]